MPSRFFAQGLRALGVLLTLFSLVACGVGWVALLLSVGGVVLGVRDLRQTRHAILRNYPVIGHLRFLLEFTRAT